MDDKEKAYMSALGFLEFCHQFGGDIYSQVLLEELLEGVMNEEAVFVFGEPDEEGNSGGDGASRPDLGTDSSD
jgi:hypothetical protein